MRQSVLPMSEICCNDSSNTLWFSLHSCVRYEGDLAQVFVSGLLIGEFTPDDVGMRNVLLYGLSQEKQIRKGALARAFGITDERLRQIRRIVEEKGFDAIPARAHGGRKTKISTESRTLLFREFDAGLSARSAFKKHGRRTDLGYRTICRVRQDWATEQVSSLKPVDDTSEIAAKHPELPSLASIATRSESAKNDETKSEAESVDQWEEQSVGGLPTTMVTSRRNVFHAGSLLLIAAVFSLGLHEAILRDWAESSVWRGRMRFAIDAIIAALGIGEKCVEGVRRLEHPSASALLRTTSPPSVSWVRRILKRYVEDEGGTKAHIKMTQNYLDRARSEEEIPAVFYIDNHMRKYTGKRKLQKGWRMQDKRAHKGTSDYYVHDEDGRPLFRVDVPMHGTLGEWMKPITELLRQTLGPKQRILMAFDRAGAFPKHLCSLSKRGFEFVTYERKPYPELPADEFTETLKLEDETLYVHEEIVELGDEKNEVRRIVLRTEDERQVNVIAVSNESTQRLVEIITGRWIQENSFKHGAERWGINQLDSRKRAQYSPGHVIVNPFRRRLEQALTIMREREGTVRRQIARKKKENPKFNVLKSELSELMKQQKALEAERKTTAKYAMLKDTELADKLVYIDTNHKTLLDTIRIACMNAESELAGVLAQSLRKPREAKKVLHNLFTATGSIHAGEDSISICIDMVGNDDEKQATQKLFQHVNRLMLPLPGDQFSRPLQFKTKA